MRSAALGRRRLLAGPTAKHTIDSVTAAAKQARPGSSRAHERLPDDQLRTAAPCSATGGLQTATAPRVCRAEPKQL